MKNSKFLKKSKATLLAIFLMMCATSSDLIAQPGLLNLVGTIPITPDSNFKIGLLGYIHYIPATDRFVVILGTDLDQPVYVLDSSEICTVRANGFKEYLPGMAPTGNYGYLACSMTDFITFMLDNTLYLGRFKEGLPPDSPVWILAKFDAVTWQKQAEIEIPLNYPFERIGDMSIAFVKGQIVYSGTYFSGGLSGGPTGSHHHFFSPDLDPLGSMVRQDTLHIPMLSFAETDSNIFMLGSTGIINGKLLLMKYDLDWNYLGSRILRDSAFFPQGTVWDGERFYVGYNYISQKADSSIFSIPFHQNVRLAVFDKNWNLLEDVAVTNYDSSDYKQPGSPWVIRHGSQLLVSYIVDTINAITGTEQYKCTAYVNIYNIVTGVSNSEINPAFQLEQNYPNPFNNSTEIAFSLSGKQHVVLKLFDIFGKEVAVLLNEIKQPGKYSVSFNADNLSGGVYMYKLETNGGMAVKKMTILK